KETTQLLCYDETMSFMDGVYNVLLCAWDKLPQLILTLIFGYLLIVIIKSVVHGLIKVSRANAAMKGILMQVIDIGLWIFLLAALLQQVGLTQVAFALSSTVAIAGIAVSVGGSSLIQDLFSGIFLAQDPDFNVGDRLKVGDIEGLIEQMDARKIRLRDDKGRLHVFPNSSFDKNPWIVLEKRGKNNHTGG
ncbi:MAG TPA: mechanosensitive ion channel domain-containing protein, partial [Candidatus Saccharimonadales bacterium]|nr:mechanosensitive ion channel domain-containing protein [Candidatus Saccharimonadales bacterium]